MKSLGVWLFLLAVSLAVFSLAFICFLLMLRDPTSGGIIPASLLFGLLAAGATWAGASGGFGFVIEIKERTNFRREESRHKLTMLQIRHKEIENEAREMAGLKG